MTVLNKQNADEIPNQETIADASKQEVVDESGKKVTFGSLIQDQKTVVVFIRHFWCSICQAYVSQLSQISNAELEKSGTKLIIVGCGDYSLISSYKKNTGFSGPIYADASRGLYWSLGMDLETLNWTPEGETRKSYADGNRLVVALKGTFLALKNVFALGKQGKFSQLGGDFVFGPGETCSLAHRMLHTEDHLEMQDLMNAAGIRFPAASSQS